MPLLVLARTTSEQDASRNKRTTRRLRMWLNGEIEEIFKEAEALQKRNQNPITEQEICFETSMHTCPLGKSQMPYGVLTTEKGGVLSLSEKN